MFERLVRTLGVAAVIVGIGKILHFRAWRMTNGDKPSHRHHGRKHPRFSHWEHRSGNAQEAGQTGEADASEAVM